eukprot:m.113308 g.113308  ORF g.113308 m.113308 type:complete len:72 (-) comp22872_c0_seq2:98-313(-)
MGCSPRTSSDQKSRHQAVTNYTLLAFGSTQRQAPTQGLFGLVVPGTDRACHTQQFLFFFCRVYVVCRLETY